MMFGYNYKKNLGLKTVEFNDDEYKFGAGFLTADSEEIVNLNSNKNYYLRIILNGTGTVSDTGSNGVERKVKAGAFFIIGPHKDIEFSPNKNSDYAEFCLIIPAKLYQLIIELNSFDKNLVAGSIKLNSKRITLFNKYLNLIEHTSIDEAYKLLPETCTLVVDCLKKLDEETFFFSDFSKIAKYLEENCSKRTSLHKLAHDNGYGYENFRKKFRQHFGVSPYRYLVNCRMDRALKLLEDSHDSIKEIADDLGYANQYEFSNHFKRHFHRTPSEYRKKGF
ncbi:AraC family transcriptional regulator [Lentisphaerota bacterium WC36G]|nr:AraC family transcriptional regulator [Lentisphaerae bacterium WC36]